MDLPWKVLNLESSSASLVVLIFACLNKGLLSQNTEYKLAVPDSVSVQRGLCVHIPCNFTYNYLDRKSTDQLYGYWFQRKDGYTHHFNSDSGTAKGLLVATNDNQEQLRPLVRNRFRLTGDPEQNNCSLSILDAQSQDAGEYYFRIQTSGLRYSYLPNHVRTHKTLQVVVTEFAEKPQILNSSAVLLGKEVVFTCSVLGPCSKMEPKFYWSPRLSGRETLYWSHQQSNGSWTYGSNLTVTPSLNDQGEQLTCQVWYPHIRDYVQNTISLDIVDPPKTVEISTNATNHHEHLALCSPEPKGDLTSAVAREGESIHLVCKADSRPDPTLIWRKGNKTLNGTKQGKEYILPLMEVRPEDAGQYQCQAENPYGSASKSLRLCVLYPPRTVAFSISQAYRRDQALFQDPPKHVTHGPQLTAQEGDSLRLLCTAQSFPPSAINWIKGSRTLKRHSPNPDNWLELTNLTVKDAGQYACRAENALGSVQGIIQLYIEYRPRRCSQSRSTCWQKDNILHCNCCLHSWPKLQIGWEVDGQKLSEGDPQVTFMDQENEVISTLSWTTGNPDKNHSIVCFGTNRYGAYTLNFLLIPPTKGEWSHASLATAVLCGALVAAIFCALCLCLIKFYKQRKAKSSSKTSGVEVLNSANGGHKRANDGSLIYSNISSVGQKSPRVDQSKAGRERISTSNPRVPSSSIAEPEELYYASLEFSKLKARERTPPEESVDYSAVKQK